MSYAVWLAPVGLAMGLVGLVAFLWSMKSGQLEDLDGAAERVLLADADRPLPASGAGAGRQPNASGTQSDRAPLQNTGKGEARRGTDR
jgi:cbb3-type cytochrome oxidase maturation protein